MTLEHYFTQITTNNTDSFDRNTKNTLRGHHTTLLTINTNNQSKLITIKNKNKIK